MACRASLLSIILMEYCFWALFELLQVLSRDDDVPRGCAFDVVNESLSMYLQLQGKLNAEVEREKLRKMKEEVQKWVPTGQYLWMFSVAYWMLLENFVFVIFLEPFLSEFEDKTEVWH